MLQLVKNMEQKQRALRNRTLTILPEEIENLKKQITSFEEFSEKKDFLNKTINGDIFKVLPLLPNEFADLIIIDHLIIFLKILMVFLLMQ